MNTTKLAAIKSTPFEIMFNRRPRDLVLVEPEHIQNDENDVENGKDLNIIGHIISFKSILDVPSVENEPLLPQYDAEFMNTHYLDQTTEPQIMQSDDGNTFAG